MEHALVRRLKELGERDWTAYGPGSEEEVEGLERRYRLRLPDDYRQLLLYSDGGTVSGPSQVLHLEPVRILKGHNADEFFEKNIPGLFVIGDDAGGDAYFYDPSGKLGRGEYALFLVPLGSLRLQDAVFVGSNLAEVVERVLAGEKLYDRPALGEEGSGPRPT